MIFAENVRSIRMVIAILITLAQKSIQRLCELPSRKSHVKTASRRIFFMSECPKNVIFFPRLCILNTFSLFHVTLLQIPNDVLGPPMYPSLLENVIKQLSGDINPWHVAVLQLYCVNLTSKFASTYDLSGATSARIFLGLFLCSFVMSVEICCTIFVKAYSFMVCAKNAESFVIYCLPLTAASYLRVRFLILSRSYLNICGNLKHILT